MIFWEEKRIGVFDGRVTFFRGAALDIDRASNRLHEFDYGLN
jgi:hypothetical protein